MIFDNLLNNFITIFKAEISPQKFSLRKFFLSAIVLQK